MKQTRQLNQLEFIKANQVEQKKTFLRFFPAAKAEGPTVTVMMAPQVKTINGLIQRKLQD